MLVAALTGATIPASPPAASADPAPPPRITFNRSTDDLGGDRAPVAGDFNGDGNDDLVWHGPGPDQLALGQPDGTFTTSTANLGNDAKPVAGDFNGDGNDDLVWHAPGPDQLALGQPDATFTNLALDAPDDRRPLVGDFDGDGNDDVVWYRPGPGRDPILFGSANGTFTRSARTVDGTYRPLRGDFDGDGRGDLFWYAPGAGADLLWYGNADRTFTALATSIGGDYRPVVANFNESGTDVRSDLLWYAAGAAPDRLWAATGTRGSFVKTTLTRGGTFRAVAGDFDGSTGADIVWHREGPADQHWLSGRRPTLTVTTFVDGGDLPDGSLGVPWDLAWTPDGALLFDERGGDINVRLPDGTVRQLTADLGDLYAVGEGGLLGMVVDPQFSTNRRFYTCQGQQQSGTHDLQVVAWQVDAGYTSAIRVADPLVGGLPVAPPSAPSPGRHSGCRLRFGPDGFLWIGTGDTASPTVPQNRASLGGKILRVDATTGAAAPDNPFVGDADPTTDARVYSYGHRNVQGLALRPGTDQMWSVEHGTFRDDEVNLLASGGNYGWDPVPASDPLFYDESRPMTDLTRHSDAVPAVRSSGNPTNAWSGAQFLTGAQWGTWEGALAVAALKDSQLHVMFVTETGAFIRQEIPVELDGTHGRLRTPMLGPDGSLYLTTSESSGNQILRITPG